MRTKPQRRAESLQTIAERIITIVSFLTCGTRGLFALSGAGIIKPVRYYKHSFIRQKGFMQNLVK